MQELPTYRPSGLIGVRAVLVTFLVGLPAAAALGWGLAWAQSAAHGAIASSICAALAALVIAIVMSSLASQAKSRNVSANTWGVICLTLVLLASRWMVAELFPGEGLWSTIRSAPFVSWWSWLCGALLEAAVIVAMALLVARNQAREPFSEKVGQWSSKDVVGELWAGPLAVPKVLSSLQEFGVDVLLRFPLAAELAGEPLASHWQTLDVEGCRVSEDPDACWLTVRVKTHERNAEGKIKSSSEDVVKYWRLSSGDYSLLRDHISSPTSASVAGGVHDGAAEASSQADAPASPERETATVLQPAVTALEAEQYKVCWSLAQAHCQHPDPQTQADAHRLCALAQSRLGQWPHAFEHFHHLFEMEPSTLNALQLATTSVMAGELARGEAWYEKAQALNQIDPSMASARLCTNYLSALEQAGEFEATMPHLDWLAWGYRAMGITDAHFVYTRGFPFFSEFLKKSDTLLRHVLTLEQRQSWYQALCPDVDEDGRQAIEQHLANPG